MTRKLSLLQHAARVAAELLTLKDPYPEPYQAPQVTSITSGVNGYPVIHIKADNYIDAGKPIEGTTYPGDVFRSVEKIEYQGGRDWVIRVNPFRGEAGMEETKPRKTIKRR